MPRRAAAVQSFIVIAVGILAEQHGGVHALARAMTGPDGSDCEPAVRRWLALARTEPRSIVELNRIVARLAKFSRSEIRRLRRRIRTESGPAGHRQAVVASLALLNGETTPIVLTSEETLMFPIVVALARLLGPFVPQIAMGLRTSEVRVQALSALSAG